MIFIMTGGIFDMIVGTFAVTAGIFTPIVWTCIRITTRWGKTDGHCETILKTAPALIRLPKIARQSAVKGRIFEATVETYLTTARTLRATAGICAGIVEI